MGLLDGMVKYSQFNGLTGWPNSDVITEKL
jgi:hypothetical protein